MAMVLMSGGRVHVGELRGKLAGHVSVNESDKLDALWSTLRRSRPRPRAFAHCVSNIAAIHSLPPPTCLDQHHHPGGETLPLHAL